MICAFRHRLVQHLETRTHRIRVGYDFDSIAEETTVEGQFVRDVRGAEDLLEEEKARVLITGLRVPASTMAALLVAYPPGTLDPSRLALAAQGRPGC